MESHFLAFQVPQDPSEEAGQTAAEGQGTSADATESDKGPEAPLTIGVFGEVR